MTRKEYRVNRIGSTQGHYVLADSEIEAIEQVRKGYERPVDFECMLWKEGKDILHLVRTKAAMKKRGEL